MKKIISIILQLPKWYAICVIILYGLLLAEYFSSINRLLIIESLSNNFFIIISRIGFILTVFSGIITWIILSFLFHLTALLFNGKSSFSRFLFSSSYPYLIPVIMIVIGIFLLDGIQLSDEAGNIVELMNNERFGFTMNLVNYSFIPYYLVVVFFIHYIYRIKYLYALLSVGIPIIAIWLISELFKFL